MYFSNLLLDNLRINVFLLLVELTNAAFNLIENSWSVSSTFMG